MDRSKTPSHVSETTSVLEGLAYSSALAGLVAGALVLAVQFARGAGIDAGLIGLALGGTVAVYNVDRLRDTERDREASPRRTAFVEKHGRVLRGLLVGSLVLCAVCALSLNTTGFAICAAVLGLGLLHRRLKRLRGIKTVYLSLCWLAIVVGLPFFGSGSASATGVDLTQLYWVAWIVGAPVVANLVASNLDRAPVGESASPRARRRKLGIAVAIAGLGLGFAAVAPASLQPLGAIAGAQFIALARYRDLERYRAVVIDGSLFVGAVIAVAWMAFARG